MKISVIDKKINQINDTLNKASDDIYKCIECIEFRDETNFYYNYKVYKKDKLINEYKIELDEINDVADDIEQQIKKHYGISKIKTSDMDNLTTEQLSYIIKVLEDKQYAEQDNN